MNGPGEIGGVPVVYIAFGCVLLTAFIFMSVDLQPAFGCVLLGETQRRGVSTHCCPGDADRRCGMIEDEMDKDLQRRQRRAQKKAD
jgi:hypothetical protein